MSILKKFALNNSSVTANTKNQAPGLTIFACPKPFTDPHIDIIQRNAITSWTLLRPRPEIILFGDEVGTAEICQEIELRHVPEVARNEFGTPLLNDIFEKAQKLATHDFMCYVNTDIILVSDFVHALNQMIRSPKNFLAVGQRCDLDIRDPWDFSQPDWEERLQALAKLYGNRRPPCWIDYFGFRRGTYSDVPSFAIGRAGWDNWLIWKASSSKVSIVDVSPSVIVIHQNHDYSHHPEGEKGVWQGEEARRNAEMIRDWTRYYTSAHANYVLTDNGIRRARGGHYTATRLELWRRRLISWTRPLRHAIGLRQ